MKEGWDAVFFQQLLDDAMRQPPPPCKDCPLATKCSEGLACWDFVFYTDRHLRYRYQTRQGIGSRVPRPEIYEYVFQMEDPPPGKTTAMADSLRRDLAPKPHADDYLS